MKYKNKGKELEIDLDDLNPDERNFYARAVQFYQSGIDWLSFDEFAFGPASPIYKGKKKPRDVVSHPLFLALKDISLELGVIQGKIWRSSNKVENRLNSREPEPAKGQAKAVASGKRFREG